MSMMPEMQGPGSAAMARGSLADYFDGEVAQTLEHARTAHEAGMKPAFRELLARARKSEKFAKQARQREKLQAILAQLVPAHQAKQSGLLDQLDPMGGGDPMMGPAQGMQPDPAMMAGPQAPPSYAAGGTHPGGPAIVGEMGPEMVDLPAGSTVHPNPGAGSSNGLLVVVRTLLDLLEQAQGGDMGLPAQDGAGQEIPGYAFGTPNARGGGFGGGQYRQPYQPPATPGPYAPDRYGAPGTVQRQDFVGPEGQFSGNQALQSLQLRNVEAGNYDPLGSEAAAQISKQAILGGMGARQAQSAKVADIYAAGDPSFRAYARLKAAADTQSEAARAYEQSRAAQVAGAQNFGRNVYLGQLGAITRKDQPQPNPMAQVGGQVLGAGLGALVGGPPGAAVGGQLGGAVVPGQSQYVPPDEWDW